MGKQFEGFTPIGPCLVRVDEFGDVLQANLTTRVNGEVKQSVRFDDLIFPIEQTIAYLSNWYAFEPGDVLLTGTPAGVAVGHKAPIYMRSGDVVEVEIERIGILRNTMIS